MIVLTNEKKLRYEKKYLISVKQARYLSHMLDAICFKDSNAQNMEQYIVRSMYFDDYQGNAYNDNETGVDNRVKYRIRIYDNSPDYISMERKIKKGNKIGKDRVEIAKGFYDAVLNDKIELLEYPDSNSMVNCFLTAYQTEYLRPMVIVDYVRKPYVYPEGDVRITFDEHISFSNNVEKFFDKKLFLQPVLPEGMLLLEVKYTEFLPEFIHAQLERFNLQQCTYSKYYLCEKYRRMGEYTYDI